MTDDDELTRLLRDAVSDVEPRDRLAELRERTAGAGQSRRWWVATGGAVVATAAAVTAIAALSGGPGPTAGPGPAATSSGTRSGTDSASPSPAETTAATPGPGRAVAAYYLGDTSAGVRLYREFRSVSEPDHGPAEAVGLLSSTPLDPDYRTAWPTGAFEGASVQPDLITITLADASLRLRPEGVTEEEAALSVEQVIFTLQAYAQARTPVQFALDGQPIDQVLGVPASEPLANGPVLDVLARVNLTEPAEGAVVDGDSLAVEGVANSFEANVVWSVESAEGGSGLGSYFTAEGYQGERLFPFSGDIDVSSLDPGTYTLTVETDDPSGGAEGGSGVFTDTRSFVIE